MKIAFANFPKTHSANAPKNDCAKNSSKQDIFFKGASYPSGYYTDEEIAYAKKYLSVEDWESKLRSEHMDVLCGKMGFFEYAFTKKPERQTETMIREARKLMFDLNNEKLAQIQKTEKELSQKRAIEERETAIKKTLATKLVNPLSDKKSSAASLAPSTALITGGTKKEREWAINWVKDKTDSSNKSFELPKNEDDALYRLETELDYAKDHYETSGQRTVLFIENFADILDSKKSSPALIGDLKEILSSLPREKAPVTIIFSAESIKNMDDAFTKNNTRIPLKIDLDAMQE